MSFTEELLDKDVYRLPEIARLGFVFESMAILDLIDEIVRLRQSPKWEDMDCNQRWEAGEDYTFYVEFDGHDIITWEARDNNGTNDTNSHKEKRGRDGKGRFAGREEAMADAEAWYAERHKEH